MTLELDISESLVLAEGAHNGHTKEASRLIAASPKCLPLFFQIKGSVQFMVIVPLFSSEIKSIESNCGYKLAKQWDDELQDDKFVISFCVVSPT